MAHRSRHARLRPIVLRRPGPALVALAVLGGAVVAGPAGPASASGPRTVVALATASGHRCAVLDDGTVKCWGDNQYGYLGLGDTEDRGDGPGEMGDSLPAVNLGSGRTVSAIAAGDGHTCVLLDNATVKCWGGNWAGQLGLGDTARRGDGPGEMGDSLPAVDLGTGRTATAIASNEGHTCAVLDNNTVKCWGANWAGQLGLGHISFRGDNAGEMGNSLPAVNLGSGRTAAAVSAGDDHTCALLDNGTVKCWGANGSGQLGLGNTVGRGDGPGEMGDSLPAVDLGSGRTAAAVNAGSDHTCAILDNGTVKCWGANGWSGRLGLGVPSSWAGYQSIGDEPGEMGDALPAVALGTGRTATAIAAGPSSTCAVLDNGTVKCWGGGWPFNMGDNLLAVDFGGGLYRVDGEIRTASQADFAGDGTYNTTGADQSRSLRVRRGRPATFVVRVGNDSPLTTDTLTVKGPSSRPGFRVTYFDGARDVTSFVGTGALEFFGIAPGATRLLRVTITPAANVPIGRVGDVKIRVSSGGGWPGHDVVAARVVVSA